MNGCVGIHDPETEGAEEREVAGEKSMKSVYIDGRRKEISDISVGVLE